MSDDFDEFLDQQMRDPKFAALYIQRARLRAAEGEELSGLTFGNSGSRAEEFCFELAEFLLARIAEDEDWANDALMRWPGGPSRVLAECEAKARLVVSGDRWTHAILATVYATHPDYREEWRQ